MIEKNHEGLYRITVGLPNNPLRSLNSYVIKGGTRNLIIDTGFNLNECFLELQAGVQELGLDMDKTDIFITHFHADHSGLAARICSSNSRVFMSAIDREPYDLAILSPDQYWTSAEELYRREGYPEKKLKQNRLHNPARKYLSDKTMSITEVFDGDNIHIGNKKLVCIHTPGHTPGHMCLYDEKEKIMFTGDHLLFDITPNITIWKALPNSLGAYIDSLKKLSKYEVKMALTGHRENNGNFNQRIGELLEHHKDRLKDVIVILRRNPGITGYEVAAQMEWSIRAKNWEDFPPGQRWFAVGEAISHLNYLVDKGSIKQLTTDNIHTYIASTNDSLEIVV